MDYTDRHFSCDCNKYLKIGPITKPLPDDFQYCEGTCDISGTLDERNTFTYEEIMKDNHREIPDEYKSNEPVKNIDDGYHGTYMPIFPVNYTGDINI